jgi:hypothetical protein
MVFTCLTLLIGRISMLLTVVLDMTVDIMIIISIQQPVQGQSTTSLFNYFLIIVATAG